MLQIGLFEARNVSEKCGDVERQSRNVVVLPFSGLFSKCDAFRRMTGTSLYGYVLRERLATALDAVFDDGDLTTIAFNAGFASHSHFTACFLHASRAATPCGSDKLAELRKIVTARPHSIALGWPP